MPRVKGFISRQKVDYQHMVLSEKCRTLMFEKKITQKQVAEYLDITPTAVYKQFKSGYITLPLFMAVITLTNADQETINDLVKVGDS